MQFLFIIIFNNTPINLNKFSISKTAPNSQFNKPPTSPSTSITPTTPVAPNSSNLFTPVKIQSIPDYNYESPLK